MFSRKYIIMYTCAILAVATMTYILLFVFLCLSIIINSAEAAAVWGKKDFKLKIIHTCDIHARFDEVTADLFECSLKKHSNPECYGGVARLVTIVKQERGKDEAMLYLDAGDIFDGTPWFSLFGWEIASKFANILRPDAMALGNHEVSNGIDWLSKFIKASNFSILACNTNLKKEPKLAALENLKKSEVKIVDGHKIGIIGTTTVRGNFGNITFDNEIIPVQKEVDNLRNEGVNIIILLSHSGYLVDQEIAAEVDGLDLIVGGHTHTFLNVGNKSINTETSYGDYPTRVINKISNRTVYIVQAFYATKYYGNLSITFDGNGEIKDIEGRPVLVDNKILPDSETMLELEKYRPEYTRVVNEELGYSLVPLDRDFEFCRMNECNFDHFFAEAMLDHYRSNYYQASDASWSDAAAAIIESGMIKMGINKTYPDDKLYSGDLMNVVPYNSAMVKVNMTGAIILEMLEKSVDFIYPNHTHPDPSPYFLQHTGIRVYYDLSKPPGSRVVSDSVLIYCTDCPQAQFERLKSEKTYQIITTDYLANGNDGYDMLKNLDSIRYNVTATRAVADYIKKKRFISPVLPHNIVFLTSPNGKEDSEDNENEVDS